jgi:CBS domain-containing protein
MKVREILRREVRVARPGSDLATIGRTMDEIGCGIVPIVNERGQAVGVVTDRDLCLALARADRRPSELKAHEVMSGDLFTCGAGDLIEEALAQMALHRVRRLPVLDERQQIIGLLSLDDVVLYARALATEDFTGPFYADIARTLMAICEHPLPAPVH